MAQSSAQRRYGGFDPADPHYFHASPALLAQAPANDDKETAVTAPGWIGWSALRTHLEARLQAEKNWRLSWWRNCGEIARFQLPRRYHAFITENDYNRGMRRDGAILNNTATLDGETCAGGIMTVCTDPDDDWLILGPGIPGLELDRQGQRFFEDLTERLRFIQDETNFYESLSQYYEDLVFFGTGVAIDYEDEDNIFVSRNPCFGEYCLASGPDGDTGALYVEERRTVSQIVEMFGYDQCPEEIKGKWRQKGGALENEYVVGYAVEPNFAVSGTDDSEAGKVPGDFTWREVYWLVGKGTNAPLSIAGFHEKPFAASQWHRVSNDPYGRGPGWTVLGDTIQLQILTAREAELVEKIARPAVVAPVALKNEPHSRQPDHVTYYDATTAAPQYKPIYEINPQAIGAVRESIAKTEERINRGNHADLFRLIQEVSLNTKRDVSATEIDALREERLMQLGPVIGRVYRYGIRPRIFRQLAIMRRRGVWPQVPGSLRQLGFGGARMPQVDFISMLTRARRASSIGAIERTYAFVNTNAGLFPQMKDDLDEDETVREIVQLGGASSRILRAAPQVRLRRTQQQRAAEMAQNTNTALAAVQGAKVMSETNLEPNNALGAVLGQR